MRSDFNKLLTEAPRLRNHWKFSDVRNAKGNTPSEDEVGGKRSIHSARRQTFVPRRRFNENLNTLRRFIASSVGRPWDKVYSEICANFDKRKVINDHILVHLFEYVEINAKMVDGRVCVLNSYRREGRTWDSETRKYVSVEGYYDKRWTPIKDDSCEWYVHPVDGLLKENKGHKTRRQAKKIRDAAQKKEEAKIFRKLSLTEELHFEDGLWYLYTLKKVPDTIRVFGVPGYEDSGYKNTTWYREQSVWYDYRPVPKDRIKPKHHDSTSTYWGQVQSNFYYCDRRIAPKKVLKANGLEGTATFEGDDKLNHREFAAMKKAA